MRALVTLAESSQFRRSGYGRFRPHWRFTHVHPNATIALFARIMPRKDPLHLQLILAGERRNLHTLPAAPVKLPSVITAFQALAIESPVGKRYPPVRTSVPHRKCPAVICPPQHERHFEQRGLCQPSAPYLRAAHRRIPKIPQKSRIRSALSLLRGLQFINQIFFHGHCASLTYRTHWDSSYRKAAKRHLRRTPVGDILMPVAMRFSTFH